MATDLTALQAAIKLVADVIVDTEKAATTPANKFLAYANIIPDIEALIPKIGELPAEVTALAPQDYATLLTTFAADMTLSTAKAQALLASSVKLISDLITYIVPDVQAVIAATKVS